LLITIYSETNKRGREKLLVYYVWIYSHYGSASNFTSFNCLQIRNTQILIIK